MKRLTVMVAVALAAMALAVPASAEPVNDDLGSAIAVTDIPFTDTADTSDAATEVGEPTEGDEVCPPRSHTVWYAVTLPTDQAIRVDTMGSDYDTTLAVYTGTGYGDLSVVACNDDTVSSLQAALTFDASAGTTYLVQAGAFADDAGGTLQITFDEPGKTTGKPVIFKSQFRGLVADAFVESFDESTGEFTFAEATLVDGRAHERGKPSKFASLFVSQFTEVFDETTGIATFTEWFGSADLEKGQYAIDKKLRSAWVRTDIVMVGTTCTGTFDEFEEPECTELGEIHAGADIAWEGVGTVERSQFKEKSTFDGVRLMFRGKFSSRNANVTGSVRDSGVAIDLDDAIGSITQQNTGDFVMIRAGG